MLGRATAAEVLVKVDDLHLLPATIDLAGAELHLLTKTGREYQLRRGLQPLLDDYDVILIDCPPSLGILTINGLTAANEVLVPLQCETLSHRGVGQLLETIDDVRAYTNPRPPGPGRDRHHVRPPHPPGPAGRRRRAGAATGSSVLQPPVPKSVKVAEAPSHGCTILRHASSSKGAQAYREIAAQLVPRSA